MNFQLVSDFTPSVAQKDAIDELIKGLEDKKRNQVLLGVTGSGKTFVMAQIIKETNRPAIILAPNKTLVAQLYQEFKSFFPNDSVEYFVSYYDYYQPEAYIARTDTFIEKDALINDQIDRLRHSATRNLLTQKNCIAVASVSAIYGLGDPEMYLGMNIHLKTDQVISMKNITEKLVEIHYNCATMEFKRGTFRVKGDILDIFPSHYDDVAWRVSFLGNSIESLYEIDALTSKKLAKLNDVFVFANSHYVTPRNHLSKAIELIKAELEDRIEYYKSANRLLEAERIKQRTNYDIEMIESTGTCKGIENYSRYLSGRGAGAPPPTLFEYLPENAIVFLDESHVMLPQLRGMYNGDQARKKVLIDYGFRLPSAKDNRPLQFEEWDALRGQSVYVSATPADLELNLVEQKTVELLVRPTGLVDPMCELRPLEGQVTDLVIEAKIVIATGLRVLVTTLTKKMAEKLHEYLIEEGIKARYMHSEVETIERIEIISKLRVGEIEVLVGVNLLREGLDIPECGLVAIMDADKEGFLRSTTSLIQTIGRAARNIEGRVILYGDKVTRSMKAAMGETERRRNTQIKYNKKYNITPTTIIKAHHDINKMFKLDKKENEILEEGKKFKKIEDAIKFFQKKMKDLAREMKFEEAAVVRDKVKELEKIMLA